MSSAEQAVAFVAMLATLETTGADREHIDELTALEKLKSAISARQARITDAFALSQRAKLVKAGTKTSDARRSVCAQIGLARRDSPSKGNRHVGLAATLVHEMPLVLRALERGEGSEWRATLIARETAHLSKEHRAQIDAAIGDRLSGWSDSQTERETRAWANRLDPNGAADRARKAVTDRRVTIRPAPDCMTYLTAQLPMKEGVGVFGVLHRAAMTAHCNPDDHRSKGQVMADELVRRTMTPGDGEPESAGIELHLVMTDRALADGDHEPAHLVGHGPVPAAIARDLLTAPDNTRVWVRRLFTDPDTGQLLTTDARRREFPQTARVFLAARDQICRTLGRPSLRGRHRALREGQAEPVTKEPDRTVPSRCGAPIRHADHALAVSKGGETTLINGAGRCENCNITKDLTGWATHIEQTGAITTTTTPTGHTHLSQPPTPPASRPWKPRPHIRRRPGHPGVQIEIHWPGEKVRSRR